MKFLKKLFFLASLCCALSVNSFQLVGGIPAVYTPASEGNVWASYLYNTGITEAGTGVSVWADQTNSHDLLQGTDSKRPTNSSGDLLFNGTSDYMQTAGDTLNQPTTIYMKVKVVSWANGRYLTDGNGVNTLATILRTSSPDFNIYAGAHLSANSDLNIGSFDVLILDFNGVSSATQVNAGTPVTGDAGSSNAGGFSLGAEATTPTLCANILVREIWIFSAAHDAATKLRIKNYLDGV